MGRIEERMVLVVPRTASAVGYAKGFALIGCCRGFLVWCLLSLLSFLPLASHIHHSSWGSAVLPLLTVYSAYSIFVMDQGAFNDIRYLPWKSSLQ